MCSLLCMMGKSTTLARKLDHTMKPIGAQPPRPAMAPTTIGSTAHRMPLAPPMTRRFREELRILAALRIQAERRRCPGEPFPRLASFLWDSQRSCQGFLVFRRVQVAPMPPMVLLVSSLLSTRTRATACASLKDLAPSGAPRRPHQMDLIMTGIIVHPKPPVLQVPRLSTAATLPGIRPISFQHLVTVISYAS